MEAEVYSPKTGNGGHTKACVSRSPTGHWLGYARTGSANYSKMAIIGANQTNNGVWNWNNGWWFYIKDSSHQSITTKI